MAWLDGWSLGLLRWLLFEYLLNPKPTLMLIRCAAAAVVVALAVLAAATAAADKPITRPFA